MTIRRDVFVPKGKRAKHEFLQRTHRAALSARLERALGISRADRVVYMAILLISNGTEDVLFSLKDLETDSGVRLNNINRSLRSLEDAGLIVRTQGGCKLLPLPEKVDMGPEI